MRLITRLAFLPADSLCCSHLDALLELTVENRHRHVLLTKRESIYSIEHPLLPAALDSFGDFGYGLCPALICLGTNPKLKPKSRSYASFWLVEFINFA